MSIRGGVNMAIQRARSIHCTAMQMFVKNNMQWFARPLTREEIRAFINHVQRGELSSIFGHANYLINLAATNPQFHANSIRALSEELARADQLELPFLVLHPGAHLGAGEVAGLGQIIAGLDEVFAATKASRVRIALENTAGQGTCLGYQMEHMSLIYSSVKHPERLAVCLDTAHLFAAGYDIRAPKGWDKALGQIETDIGLDQIVAFHLNDSKTALGSRVDRHEHIGYGQIGLEGFRFLVNDSRFQNLPGCLETPKSQHLREDVRNLRTLRSLIATAQVPRKRRPQRRKKLG
jgi:deoxyribonuclease-4